MERTSTDITWDEYIAAQHINNLPNMMKRTNILCPVCGKYIYKNLGVILTTYPPQYRYECECGWNEVSF